VVLEISADELVLLIIGLARAINPAMLKAEKGDFTVDFSPLEGKEVLSSDEELLVKLRIATEAESGSLDLEGSEARRLGTVLKRIETLQKWPIDVLNMSRALRTRLSTVV
jgi:hypothetical protein